MGSTAFKSFKREIRGASPAAIWSARVANHDARSYRDMCCICLGGISNDNVVKVPCCHQQFHVTCFAEWTCTKQATCPYCRDPIYYTKLLRRTIKRQSRVRIPRSLAVHGISRCWRRYGPLYMHLTPSNDVCFTVWGICIHTIKKPLTFVSDDSFIYIVTDNPLIAVPLPISSTTQTEADLHRTYNTACMAFPTAAQSPTVDLVEAQNEGDGVTMRPRHLTGV